MRRAVGIAAAVVLAQAAVLGVYWAVEHGRGESGVAPHGLGTAPPVAITGSPPPLSLIYLDGEMGALKLGPRPTLVHFWATWCAPCEKELPHLFSLPRRAKADVIAVALDEDRSKVEAFVGPTRDVTVALGRVEGPQAVPRDLPAGFAPGHEAPRLELPEGLLDPLGAEHLVVQLLGREGPLVLHDEERVYLFVGELHADVSSRAAAVVGRRGKSVDSREGSGSRFLRFEMARGGGRRWP